MMNIYSCIFMFSVCHRSTNLLEKYPLNEFILLRTFCKSAQRFFKIPKDFKRLFHKISTRIIEALGSHIYAYVSSVRVYGQLSWELCLL